MARRAGSRGAARRTRRGRYPRLRRQHDPSPSRCRSPSTGCFTTCCSSASTGNGSREIGRGLTCRRSSPGRLRLSRPTEHGFPRPTRGVSGRGGRRPPAAHLACQAEAPRDPPAAADARIRVDPADRRAPPCGRLTVPPVSCTDVEPLHRSPASADSSVEAAARSGRAAVPPRCVDCYRRGPREGSPGVGHGAGRLGAPRNRSLGARGAESPMIARRGTDYPPYRPST